MKRVLEMTVVLLAVTCAAAQSPKSATRPAKPATAATAKPVAHNVTAKPVDNTAALLEVTMRSVRMHSTLLDPLNQPVSEVEWNSSGTLMKITETSMISLEDGGSKESYLMFRYLLIPNAPWMQMGSGKEFIATESGHLDRIGEESTHKMKIPGQEPASYLMWKSIDTNGKWVMVFWLRGSRIYQADEDGTASEIGSITYKSLALETGETVLLFMTKGTAPDSVWEGDVKDTMYRELTEGKGTPVAKLAYRPFKQEDGTMSVLLMSRPLQGKAVWTGARNGKIVESTDSN